jgi:hypothetical protein
MPEHRNQEIIDDLVTQAVERFRKNHCDEDACERAKEKDLLKKMVFDTSSVSRINCGLCARYGVKMPKDALDIFRHISDPDRCVIR